MKILHLLSGGMDSVCALYYLSKQRHNIKCLLFNYGQRNLKELRWAKHHADNLGLEHSEIALYKINGLFSRSALTDGMGNVQVPNRNAVFLNIAASIAMSERRRAVSIGCNADDARRFPDCTRRFLTQQRLIWEDMGIGVDLLAPFATWTKKEIVKESRKLLISIEDSWSCYKDGPEPCGKCLACRLRKDAIK